MMQFVARAELHGGNRVGKLMRLVGVSRPGIRAPHKNVSVFVLDQYFHMLIAFNNSRYSRSREEDRNCNLELETFSFV